MALAAALPQYSSVPDPNMFPPPVLHCAEITYSAPFIADCEKALEQVAPVKPEFCTFIFAQQQDIVTVGSCTIHTYSERGSAHCLDGNDIRSGVKAILCSCTKDSYTQGSYTWTPEGELRDGVKLIKSAI